MRKCASEGGDALRPFLYASPNKYVQQMCLLCEQRRFPDSQFQCLTLLVLLAYFSADVDADVPVQGDTEAEYVGAAVWRMFLPGKNPFVEVSDTLVLTGDCKARP